MTKAAVVDETSEEFVQIGSMAIRRRVLWEYQADLSTAVALFATDPRIMDPHETGPLLRRTRQHLADLAALLAGAAGKGARR